MIQSGMDLIEGRFYRVIEIDPSDDSPSLQVGSVLLCKDCSKYCLSPENHLKDGSSTEWFADYQSDGSYGTLVSKLELVDNKL